MCPKAIPRLSDRPGFDLTGEMDRNFPHPADQPEIRAVTFDAGGTLVEPRPSVGHVYAEVAADFGVADIPPERLTAAFSQAWKATAHFDYSRESWFVLVRETFAADAVRLPEAYFPAVYDRFAEPDVWHVFEDVLPTLETLASRGVKLGVISNWDERLRPLLARLGLAKYFSSIVVSCEAGAAKPDPRIFRRATAELAVAPVELLHVGDSLITDVRGAGSIGANGVLLDRRDRPSEVLRVRSLEEIAGLVARCSPES